MTFDLLESTYRGFSAPYEPFNESLTEPWVVEYTKRAIDALMRHCASVGSIPAALLDALDSGCETVESFADAWHPSFGAIRVQRDAGRVCGDAVEVALRLHELGAPADWSVVLREPRDLWFSGTILRAVASVSCQAADGRLRLSWATSDGSTSRLEAERIGAQWIGQDTRPWPSAHSLQIGEWPVREAADAEDLTSGPGASLASAARSGLALIHGASSDYEQWVGRLVRHLLPLRRTEGQVHSWSSRAYPGMVAISLFDSPSDMAETLVHEASHQYYHLVSVFGPIVNGRDTELHWSPVKRTRRPLDRVLLAYHAFANVALFFHEAHAAGLLNEATYKRDERELSQWFAAMTPILERTDGLTEIGDALWRPLSDRLRPLVGETVGAFK